MVLNDPFASRWEKEGAAREENEERKGRREHEKKRRKKCFPIVKQLWHLVKF